MKISIILISLIFFSLFNLSHSQSIRKLYSHLGKLYIAQMASAPFPHHERANGHTYKDKHYPANTHYNDSSVAIFIPNNFRKSEKINLVVYFHGWRNNIDTTLSRFKLIGQFSQSKKNAIFVFPEGPKNAPDSFGGKLEEKNGLKKMLSDVIAFLKDSSKINTTHIGNIILAGHSGAYQVIASCLEYGGITENISDVFLFDALYGRTEIYLNWIKDYKGRFIDIYTDNSGTKDDSENLITTLDSMGLEYFKTEEIQLKESGLLDNRLLFIHTDLKHNQVIAERKQFLMYLKTSAMESISKYLEKNLTKHIADDRYASYSPDGKQIIFESNRDGNWEIYLMKTDGSNQQRLTNNAYDDRRPSWHPNGEKIVYESNSEGSFQLYELNINSQAITKIKTELSYMEPIFTRYSPDGSKLAFSNRLSENESNIIIFDRQGKEIASLANYGFRSFYPQWSADGKKILFFSRHETNNQDDEIYTLNIDDSDKQRLTHWPKHNFCPAFSNNGNKIAYVTSMENSRPEIYIMDAHGENKRRITYNDDGDTLPHWSGDDKKLLITGYRNGNYEILEIGLSEH